MKINKISIIEPVGGHGGLDFYNLGLTEAISQKNYTIYLYTSDTTKLDVDIKDIQTNVRKYYKGLYTDESKIIRGLRYIKSTILSLIKSKIDGVKVAHFHIFNFSNLEYLNMKLFKIFGMKIVATIHDVDKLSNVNEAHSKSMYNKFQSVIDKVIVHTDFTKKELEKKFNKMSCNDISVVPHGDMDFVYNIDIDQESALNNVSLEYLENKKIILLFGQIKKVKGLDVLLKSFAKIKNKHQDTVVLVVGKLWKNEEDEYIKIIEDNAMQEQIKLELKFIDNRDVPLYFKAADIVALPYKKIYNSGVILRALDYGSTVLVSDLEPLTKVINHSQNGFVFKSEDVNDMALKLDELLKDNNLREKLKKNATEYIEEKFSWTLIAQKTIDVYNQALEKK